MSQKHPVLFSHFVSAWYLVKTAVIPGRLMMICHHLWSVKFSDELMELDWFNSTCKGQYTEAQKKYFM